MCTYDLAVVGEGIAGLACAARAVELGLSVTTLEANMMGGLVLNISALHGHEAGRPGVELASEYAEANMAMGAVSQAVAVSEIDGKDGAFVLTTDSGIVQARKVVVATGARLRKMGVPGEAELEHRGVSQCVDCDGPMLTRKPAVVVGGGDSAWMQAAVLAQYASEVTLVMRGDRPRARPEFVAAVAANDRIAVLPGTSVVEIVGNDAGVTGVKVASNGTERVIPCEGVFAYVGLQPNAELLGAADAVATDAHCQTDRRGLYAIGAVREGYSGNLADAVADGRRAAEHAAAS
jgi:thioredoxin reductase (NADPH)